MLEGAAPRPVSQMPAMPFFTGNLVPALKLGTQREDVSLMFVKTALSPGKEDSGLFLFMPFG